MIGTPWEIGGGSGAVSSVNGQTGAVVLAAADVGADSSGAGAAAVSEHAAASDPHPVYPRRTEAGQPDGYAQLDGGGLVPSGQLGSGAETGSTFLRGDRSWAEALQGNLGGTDHALVRADGSGGLTAQGSPATLDDSGNLMVGSRGFHQPITPSAWAGATTSHDLPLPTWATATGKYFALVRVRAQQNSTTTSFMARSVQIELSLSSGTWSIDATGMYTSMGPLATSLGWMISGGTNLRMTLAGVGAGNAGNVGLFFEQFVFYGAL